MSNVISSQDSMQLTWLVAHDAVQEPGRGGIPNMVLFTEENATKINTGR